QVMIPAKSSITDVHPWTFSNSLKSFQNLDRIGPIIGHRRFICFTHVCAPSICPSWTLITVQSSDLMLSGKLKSVVVIKICVLMSLRNLISESLFPESSSDKHHQAKAR